MEDDQKMPPFQQILVALDCSKHSYAALKAAVVLARHFDASLTGVFIEDARIMALADSPFCTEIGEYTAARRNISYQNLSKGIRVQYKWINRTFTKLIKAADIEAKLHVHQGKITEILIKLMQDYDLMIIGKIGTSIIHGQRFGSTARAMIQACQKPILLLEEGNKIGYPTLLYYNGSKQGKLGLERAKSFLDPGETLVIIVDNQDQKIFNAHAKKLKAWSKSNYTSISIESIRLTRPFSFLQMISSLKIGLFILPTAENESEKSFYQQCLKEVQMPILMIKPPPEQSDSQE
jgi:nucleotide-binding universal stress UspA family protein